MAKRILVPLDGSLTAETILPLVADAARGRGGTVRFLHVAPVPGLLHGKDGRVVAYADQEMERLRSERLDYLATAETSLGGVPVERVVRFGEPLVEILAEAGEFDADLIAVTTAGRSGLRRGALGSVADQVFRKAGVPVALFRAARDFGGEEPSRA